MIAVEGSIDFSGFAGCNRAFGKIGYRAAAAWPDARNQQRFGAGVLHMKYNLNLFAFGNGTKVLHRIGKGSRSVACCIIHHLQAVSAVLACRGIALARSGNDKQESCNSR